MRILVSNDDGVGAKGMLALAEAMAPLGEVWVVAPEENQSATSHSLSLHDPLRLRKHGERVYGVDGTPADSVYLAITHLLKDERPVLVVAGINHGPNVAEDVFYSGTVAAAMEGSMLGVPSIAFSLAAQRDFDFTHAAEFARAFVEATLARELPKRMLLNVNIPPGGPVRGYEMTRLGRHSYGADVVERQDPRGRRYYWIGGTGYEHVKEPGTDVSAVYDEGRASVTPLMLDLTDHTLLAPLRAWSVPGFSQHR